MQKISFGNKEYVKASEIAKKFRYTQDYVGQLCRSKKVAARLVGRTWYVEPDSVTAYRKTKHKTQKQVSAKAKLAKTKPRITNPKPVQPVARAKTIKTVAHPSNSSTIHVQYAADEAQNIPVLTEKSVRVERIDTEVPQSKKSITIKKIVPKTLPIAKLSKETKFTTENLPEISLSGNLKVVDSQDEFTQIYDTQTTTKPVSNIATNASRALGSKQVLADNRVTKQSAIAQPVSAAVIAQKRTQRLVKFRNTIIPLLFGIVVFTLCVLVLSMEVVTESISGNQHSTSVTFSLDRVVGFLGW